MIKFTELISLFTSEIFLAMAFMALGIMLCPVSDAVKMTVVGILLVTYIILIGYCMEYSYDY